MSWTVDFYRDEHGTSNVEDFLENINNKKLKAKVLRDINLLQQHGTQLKEPQVKYIEDGIWELRTKQSTNIARVFYFAFSNNVIILLNGFIKKSSKTPPEEITRAKKYKNDYTRRFK